MKQPIRSSRPFSCIILMTLVFSLVADARGDDRFTIGARQRGFVGLDKKTEGTWKGPFFFVQLADPQYGMLSGNRDVQGESALVGQAVEMINRLKPRFVLVSGDLTHATPGHAQYERQVRQFHEDFAKLDKSIPIVCVCGNHDVGNQPTDDSLACYRKHFGDDYFSFWVGGVKFIVVNTCLIKDPPHVAKSAAVHKSWMKAELAAAETATAQQVIVCQHHPWFLATPDEPDQYFNIPLERRTPLLEAMAKANVTAAFAGHYHRNALGKGGTMEMVVSGPVGRPLGNDPSGLRIVKVFADCLDHEYYGLDDVPQKVELER